MWKIMRFIIFVIVCTAQVRALSDEVMNLMKTLHERCVAAVGVGEDVIARAQVGNFDDDEKLRCYMRCGLNEMGGLDSEGKIAIDHLIDNIPADIKEQLSPVLRKCSGGVGANECETAFLMAKCVFDTEPSMYFLP